MGSKDQLVFPGPTLKCFVDVFFILFDNILKHCGIVNEPLVTVSAFRTNKKVHIVFENEVNSNLNIPKGNEKLRQIKQLMEEVEATDNVKREGGTGLYKIKKILAVDLKIKNQINFEITQDHYFKVWIEIGATRNCQSPAESSTIKAIGS